VCIEGRPLQLLHAYSAQQALMLVADHPELAVALIDVVMETADAGLRLVQHIRQLPGRQALRLILRTGQPGQALELSCVQQFDITDHWHKLDQSRTQVLVGLTAAIRSYRQFADMAAQREVLQRLNLQLQAALLAQRRATQAREQAERALIQTQNSVESEITRRTDDLMQAVRSLETFNQMVAHDLRGPLSSVSGLIQLVKRRLAEGELSQLPRWLDLITVHTDHLSHLVGSLLDLSRLARSTMKRQACALQPLAEEAVDMLRVGQPMDMRQVRVELGHLPEVVADPVLLRQVFLNLIGNGIKFSRGTAMPQVQVTARSEPDQILVSVSDNGVGFDSDLAPRLFQPFERLHGTEYVGTGIGLTAARHIVEMHGGRIWAESRVGQGATFRFVLPAATSDA
jgi:signal transduction histidine kinase